MAQADGVVANGTGSAVRSDINGQYAALWSNHSGSTEPSTGKVAYQFWADTNTNILKIRNSGNSAWISLFTLAGGVDVDAASNFNEDVTFTGASYNLVWDKSDNALEFADNAKCTFGASDFVVYHDGSHTYLDKNGDGNLFIRTLGTDEDITVQAEKDLYLKVANGETAIKAIDTGAVELYYANFKSFTTKSNGISLYGPEGVDCNIDMSADDGDDNADLWRIVASANGDWSLYNYASGGWEKNIECNGNGNVELYYDNSTRLVTTSAGVTVIGDLLLDNSDHAGSDILWDQSSKALEFADGVGAVFGNGDDLQIFHDSNNSFIKDAGTGRLSILTNELQLTNAADSEVMILATQDSDVELYYDGVKRFETGPGYNLSTGDVSPSATNTYNLGGTSARWATVYASNALDTSDRNEKNTILESDLGLDFVNKLKPISYKWNDTNLGNKTHYGLIAQDVEEAIISEGKALNDFGAIEKPEADPMSLGYKELIAPLIKAIQELSAKVVALEAK